MEKEKIKSISHTEKVWLIRVKPTSRSVEYINNILTKFNLNNAGVETTYLDWCDCCDDKPHKFSLNYSEWKNQSIDFYPDEDSGYIFFMEDRIEILLLKNSKLFDKLRDEFLEYFEMIKPKPLKSFRKSKKKK